MSHRASSWLAEIPAAALSGSQFRVLFHLCDAHNSKRDPETACFPSQERLREATGLSNGGLNNALNALEQAGFIRRRRRTVPGSAIQRTYYILGCDFGALQEQTPETGVGANSTLGEANSTSEGGKLHPGGDEPVRNREKEPRARADARVGGEPPATHSEPPGRRGSKTPRAHQAASPHSGAEKHAAPTAHAPPGQQALLERLAEWINSGRHVPPSAVTNTQRDALLRAGLVTPARLRELGIS